jgi:hypothetical protein
MSICGAYDENIVAQLKDIHSVAEKMITMIEKNKHN